MTSEAMPCSAPERESLTFLAAGTLEGEERDAAVAHLRTCASCREEWTRLQSWVTGAETAELALSLLVSGEPDRARRLLVDVQHLRHDDGSYWTGLVYDENARWPAERSSWTAAAMVLAADAFAGGPTLALFAGDDLPTGVLLPADTCVEEGCTALA